MRASKCDYYEISAKSIRMLELFSWSEALRDRDFASIVERAIVLEAQQSLIETLQNGAKMYNHNFLTPSP